MQEHEFNPEYGYTQYTPRESAIFRENATMLTRLNKFLTKCDDAPCASITRSQPVRMLHVRSTSSKL